VIVCRPTRIWRRVLGLAVCYAVALQAFLAAVGAALAINHGSGAADAFSTICHAANDTTRPTGDAAIKLPCALCAVAAAGGGLVPDPIPAAVAPLAGGSVVRLADTVAVFVTSQVRDGLARAPPNFA
jgi:hypothetical protein